MPRRRDSRRRNVYAVAGLPLRGARGWGEELRAHAFTESVRDSRGRGILLIGSSGNEVSHNSASGSARAAIGLVASDDNLVDANSTSRNPAALYAAESPANQVPGTSSASTVRLLSKPTASPRPRSTTTGSPTAGV